MRLTKVFPPGSFSRALESWSWLDVGDKRPVLASLFGDVFFVASDGYWFLDSFEGTLIRSWANRDDLQAELESEKGQDRYLLGGLAMAADRSGMILGSNEVFDFVVPPILGGAFSVDNITKDDFVVSLHIAGQLLHQVKDLPPGTPITGLTVGGERP
jgi:hypothetical protein